MNEAMLILVQAENQALRCSQVFAMGIFLRGKMHGS